MKKVWVYGWGYDFIYGACQDEEEAKRSCMERAKLNGYDTTCATWEWRGEHGMKQDHFGLMLPSLNADYSEFWVQPVKFKKRRKQRV